MDMLLWVVSPEKRWRLLALATPVLITLVLLGAIGVAGHSAATGWSTYTSARASTTLDASERLPQEQDKQAPRAEWAKLKTRFTCRHSGSRILEEIDRHAHEVGLTVSGITPLETDVLESMTRHRMLLELSGAFPQLAEFLYRIEQSAHLMRTHALEVWRSHIGQPLSVKLTVDALCIPTADAGGDE